MQLPWRDLQFSAEAAPPNLNLENKKHKTEQNKPQRELHGSDYSI